MRRLSQHFLVPISIISGFACIVIFFKLFAGLTPKNPNCNFFSLYSEAALIIGGISFLIFSKKTIGFLGRRTKHQKLNLFLGMIILGYLGFAAIVLLVLVVLFSATLPQQVCVPKDYGFVEVIGSSMDPTYDSGKPTYVYLPKEQLHRGCIVVSSVSKYVKDFPKYDDKGPTIKRIIAIPGDSLAISRGDVFINGKIISEPYINEPGTWLWPEGKIKESVTTVLAANEYFIMGDNRNHSGDSRLYGPIKIDDIIGYANDPKHPDLNTCK